MTFVNNQCMLPTSWLEKSRVLVEGLQNRIHAKYPSCEVHYYETIKEQILRRSKDRVRIQFLEIRKDLDNV